jgi:hypothetical protein
MGPEPVWWRKTLTYLLHLQLMMIETRDGFLYAEPLLMRCFVVCQMGPEPVWWRKTLTYLLHWNQIIDVAVIAPFWIEVFLEST